MRLLLLNPNMTQLVTDQMAETAKSVAALGTEIKCATARRGLPYIGGRAEAQIGGAIVLEMIAESLGDIDAAVVAAFGDPGVQAARELFDLPIVGVSEAAMLTACLLGVRFAIVTFSPGLVGWYGDCVELNGMTGRCAGVHALDMTFAEASSEQPAKTKLLVNFAAKVIRETNADSLIFGGAPLTGLAARVREQIPVPIIDPVAAAVKQAEALLALATRKPTIGSFRRPAPKATFGLPESLAGWIEHRTGRRT